MTTIKSVHIEGCWPYQYEEPKERRVFKRETMDRANARKREVYHRNKKLLQLRVYEMNDDICNGGISVAVKLVYLSQAKDEQ